MKNEKFLNQKIEKNKLEIGSKLKNKEQLNDPEILIEKNLKELESQRSDSADIVRESLQDILSTLEKDGDTKDDEENEEMNLFIAYQGIEDVEQYLAEEDGIDLKEIKNSLAKKLGELNNSDINDGEEIGQMINLDEELERTKEKIKKGEVSDAMREKYLFLDNEIKKRQKEILGDQRSFYNQYASKIKNAFKKAGEKVDNWANGRKLVDFIRKRGLGTKFATAAGAGVIALMIAGKMFNPDIAQAAEGDYDQDMENQKHDFIEMMIKGGMSQEQAKKVYEAQMENVRGIEAELEAKKDSFLETMKNQGLTEEQAERAYENRANSVVEARTEIVEESDKVENDEKVSRKEVDNNNFIEAQLSQLPNVEFKNNLAEAGFVGVNNEVFIIEQEQEVGEQEMVEKARNNPKEAGYYYAEGEWATASKENKGSNEIDIDKDVLARSLKSLKDINDIQGEKIEKIFHYHTHPVNKESLEKMKEIEELRPIPPSIQDIKFYIEQEMALEEGDGVEFEGKVVDSLGIWTIKEVDSEKMNQTFVERMKKGEISTFDELYRPLINKYMWGGSFGRENIEKFVQEAQKIGIELEYKIKMEADFNNRVEALQKMLDKNENLENSEQSFETQKTEAFNEALDSLANDERFGLDQIKSESWQKFLEKNTLNDLWRISEDPNELKQGYGIDFNTVNKLKEAIESLQGNDPFSGDTYLEDIIIELNERM